MKPRPPFLDTLAEADRDALIARLTMRSYRKGETVISTAEQDRDVFFVIEGRAHTILHSRDGKAVGYRDIGPGDMFGELAAIDGQPRSASIVAVEQIRVGCLSHAAFRTLVDTHSGIAWTLLTHLSTQIRHMTGRIFEYSTLLVRERLIRELLRLADADIDEDVADRAAETGAGEISPAPTHFDLAARISTHREAVSREMSALAKQGLVEKRAGVLHLHDISALEALCPPEG